MYSTQRAVGTAATSCKVGCQSDGGVPAVGGRRESSGRRRTSQCEIPSVRAANLGDVGLDVVNRAGARSTAERTAGASAPRSP